METIKPLLHSSEGESRKQQPPRWFSVCAVVFGGLTLLFFMALVVLAIIGHEVPKSSKFVVIIVLALGSGLSANFIGGTAAAKGKLPIRFAKLNPITFGVSGGIAVTIIVLILGTFLYQTDQRASVEELFSILEDPTKFGEQRLGAFKVLKREYRWTDFSGRD